MSPAIRRMAVVVHEGARTGPPIMALEFLGWLSRNEDIELSTYVLEDGPLVNAFSRLGRTEVLHLLPGAPLDRGSRRQARESRHRRRHEPAPDLILVNTAISVHGLRHLPWASTPVVSLIHELEVGLTMHLRDHDRRLLLERTDHFIAGAACIASNLVDSHGVDRERITVAHEFIDVDAVRSPPSRSQRDLRRQVGAGDGVRIIGGAGSVIWRKGPDLFVALAAAVLRDAPDTVFCWVGGPLAGDVSEHVHYEIEALGLRDRVHFVGLQDEPYDWYRLFDVFVLTSREDAFPLVALEAAALEIPVVCFDTGCLPELVRDDAGVVTAYPEIQLMADAVVGLLEDDERRWRLGSTGRRRVTDEHATALGARRWWNAIRSTAGANP